MHRLVTIEQKRVKGVKEQLDKSEIVEKIKSADKFIDRLKYGEDSAQKVQEYDPFVAKSGSEGFASKSDLNFLQKIVQHTIPLKGGTGPASLNELKDLIGSMNK